MFGARCGSLPGGARRTPTVVTVIEPLLAALGLLVCAALLLRMALGPERQRRWDAFWRRRVEQLQTAGRWLQRQGLLLRSSRGARQEAARTIERARHAKPQVDREGNVIRPRRFRRDDDPDPPTLH